MDNVNYMDITICKGGYYPPVSILITLQHIPRFVMPNLAGG